MARRKPSLILLFLALPTLFLPQPAAVRAEPPKALIEIEWSVHPDGTLLAWPHHRNDAYQHEKRVARPFFGKLEDELPNAGLLGLINILLPGSMDLASQCDATYHFQKLGLGLTDEDLIRRIATPAEKMARTEPLRRRARLDRLLAVRLIGDRGIGAAVPALGALHADADAPPRLRDAARDALTRMGKPPCPPPHRRWTLPPLDDLLKEMPGSAELVVIVNQGSVPRWTGLAALAREAGLETCYPVIERFGSKITWQDRAVGQIASESPSELPYELARRYGNAHLNRSVTGVRFAASPLVWHHCEGQFDVARIRERLEKDGVDFENAPLRLTVRSAEYGFVLTVTPNSLRLVVGEWESPAGGEALVKELRLAGSMACTKSALWAHLRRLPAAPLPPPLSGLTRATLNVVLHDGVRATVEAHYAQESAARGAASALAKMRESLPPALDWIRWPVEVKGTALTGRLEIEASTPIEALRWLLRDLASR